MRVPKKFLMLLCIAAFLIFSVGCGADSSDAPTPASSGSSGSSAQKWWFNSKEFVKRYNAALDAIGKKNHRDYDILKIVEVKKKLTDEGMCFFRLKLYNSKSDIENSQLENRHQFDVEYVNLPADNSIGDENIYKIRYITSDNYIDDMDNAIFQATLLALPQFNDLDYSKLNEDLKMLDLATAECNGLHLYVNTHNGLLFIITDIATEQSIKDYKNQQIISEGNANINAALEKRKNSPSKTFPTDPNYERKLIGIPMPPLSLGKIGLGYDKNQTNNVPGLGSYEWKSDSSIDPYDNCNREYRDVIVTYIKNKAVCLVSCSNFLKTDKGIHEGSTLKEVFAAYGNRCAIDNSDGATVYKYPYELDDGKFAVVQFVAKDNAVDYIVIKYIDADEKNKITTSVKEVAQSSTNAPAQNNQPVDNPPAENNSSALNLGGIGLNDSIEKVRQVFGREDKISGEPTKSKHEYKDIVITYNGRRITALISYSPAVKTERNIHEGSTLQEVINAYGRRCAVQNFDGTTLYEYPYDMPQGSLAVMRFAVKNGVVDYISLRIVTDAKEKSDILSAMKTL